VHDSINIKFFEVRGWEAWSLGEKKGSMVLEIRETIVLQSIELGEKADKSHFWVFRSFVVLMGKHGFAEKLHLQLN
jgi:hypothetical protein